MERRKALTRRTWPHDVLRNRDRANAAPSVHHGGHSHGMDEKVPCKLLISTARDALERDEWPFQILVMASVSLRMKRHHPSWEERL